jgi:hypothetical protein
MRASTSPVRRRRPPSRLRFPAIVTGLIAFALLPVLALGLPVVKAAIPSEDGGTTVSGPEGGDGTASAGSIGAGASTPTPVDASTGTPTATPVPAPVAEAPAPTPVPEGGGESPAPSEGQPGAAIATTPQPETEPDGNPAEDVIDASGTDPPTGQAVVGGTLGDIPGKLSEGVTAGASVASSPADRIDPGEPDKKSGEKRPEREDRAADPVLPTPPTATPSSTPTATPTLTPTAAPVATPETPAVAASDATGAGATAGASAGAAALLAGSSAQDAAGDEGGQSAAPTPLVQVLFGATPTPMPTTDDGTEAVANVAAAFADQAAPMTKDEVVTDPADAEVVPSPVPPSAGPDPLAAPPDEALGADGCSGAFWDLFSGCAEEDHAEALDCSGTFLKAIGLPFDSCGGGSTAYFCIELGAGCLGGVFESHCDPTEVPGQPLTYPCSNHTAPLVELPIPGADGDHGHSGVPFPKGKGPDDLGLKKWLPNGGGIGVVPDLANLDDPKAQEYLLFYGLKSFTKGRWTVGPSLLGALSWEPVDRGDDGAMASVADHAVKHEVEEEPVYSGGFTFDVGTHFEIGKRRFGIEVGGLAYLSGVWAGPELVAAADPYWAATAPAPGPVIPTVTATPAQATATPTAIPTAIAATPPVDAPATSAILPGPTSSVGPPVATPTPTGTAAPTEVTPAPLNATPPTESPRPTPSPSAVPAAAGTPVAATTEPGPQATTAPPAAQAPAAEAPAASAPIGAEPEETVVVPEDKPEVVLLDPVTHLVVGTCADGACGLNRRVAPSTDADVVGVSLDGDTLEIVCQTTGDMISNGRARSAIWNRLSDGTWVSDFYVDTPNVGTRSYPAC